MEPERAKTAKPVVGGVLNIVGGVFGGLIGLIVAIAVGTGYVIAEDSTGIAVAEGIIAVILGIVAIAGGVYAVRRKVFGLAVAGAISALACGVMFLVFGGWGAYALIPIGIIALVLIAVSRPEFA